jgi:hypothetical protein
LSWLGDLLPSAREASLTIFISSLDERDRYVVERTARG